jgi:putative ABC transport system permease protein
MRDLLHDVRLALRGLMGRPGFTLVAISTIALGIGAAGAIWSVVDAVLVASGPATWRARPT